MKRRHFLQSSMAAALATYLPANKALAAAAAAAFSEVSGDINALKGSGSQVTLAKASVQDLSDSLRGRLLLPGFEGYESARKVLNPTIDKHPALIVQPSGAADIMNAVSFAGDNELLVAV